MKRTIIILLIFALCLTFVPATVWAQQTDYRYTQDQIDAIVQKYENSEDTLNALFCTDVAVGYWGMANEIKQNGVLYWALDMSSKLIGEYPEKQDYAEMLANLITMQSGELAEQIETQSRFDDLKDIGDYAWDVVEIAAAFVGASGALEAVSAAIDTGVSGIGDVIIQNNDQAKFYEAALQDYSQSYAFLNAISEYAENEELRQVALSLLEANEALLIKRLEYLADVGENIAEYEAQFFIKNMSMELLKEADLYATDETVKFFVDEGVNLKNAILSARDAANFMFKLLILAGDIGFGTSDVYNRYQEMKVLADISGALVKANEKIHLPGESNLAKLEVIQEKCNLYKALIVTHARGEYLLYQLLMNDAGALSDIRWIIEYFKNPEDTTDAWYEGQVSVLTKYCNILDNMFVVSSAIAEGKQLTLVNCIRDNGTSNQYNLTYNENGLLETYSTDYYSSSGNNHYEYQYTYNQNDQLVQYQNIENVYPERKNYYSEDGILIGWSYWEYDTFEYKRHCEYDGQGRLIREYADDGSYNTVYSYNEAGLVSCKTNDTVYGDMNGSSKNTYLYDSSGRLIEETSTSDWGFGEETTTLKYRYDYFPFILVESYYDGTYSSSDLRYEDVSMLSIYLDGTAEFEMNDGYLSKVTCEDCVYEFFYDGAFDESFDEHIPDVKYEDEITGTYLAKYEDVQITIDADNSSEYFLTYTASGVTLERIPLAYFNSNTSTEKMLMFIIDDYYPQYSGYVEVCWMKDSLFPYSYNALIDGLDDTDGYYSDLTKTETAENSV